MIWHSTYREIWTGMFPTPVARETGFPLRLNGLALPVPTTACWVCDGIEVVGLALNRIRCYAV